MLAQRAAIWVALADLYLDTELAEADYKRIAAALRESGLRWAEIEAINADEVAPVLVHNLLSVAGEWSGFDEKWLLTSIAQRKQLPTLFWSRKLWRSFVGSMLKDDLAKLKAYFSEL